MSEEENEDIKKQIVYRNVEDAIAMRASEGKIEVQKIKAAETAKEVAGKHLAKLGAFYLMFTMISFIFAIQYLSAETISVVAGLVTLVVTNLSSILKSVVEVREAKDPLELMHDLAESNSSVAEEHQRDLVRSGESNNKAILAAGERQHNTVLKVAESQHEELLKALKDAQKSEPTITTDYIINAADKRSAKK